MRKPQWDTVVAALEEGGYDFAVFLDEVTSGDPYLVQNALTEGTNLLVSDDAELVSTAPTVCGPTFCIGIVAVVAVAAVVSTVAAGYNYVGGVNVYLKALVWGPAAAEEGSGLLMEQNISRVTEALAV